MYKPWKARGFVLALSVSLAAHGVLLFATFLPLPLQTHRLSGVIEVSLSGRKARNPRADVEEEAPSSVSEPMPSKPKAKRTRRMVQPTPLPVPVVEAIPATAAEMESGLETEGEPVAVTTSASMSDTSGGRDGVGGKETFEGMDDALLEYRIAIVGAARRFKRYPALSRERGREGRVEVRLSWRPGMHAPQVDLHRSAGDVLLDGQGLAMLRRAVLQTPLPDILRGRAFSFVQSIEFSLKDAD
jgi:TonB family protein